MTLDRENHLKNLANEYEVDFKWVCSLAGLLGENEDFDGLITELEDYETYGFIENL